VARGRDLSAPRFVTAREVEAHLAPGALADALAVAFRDGAEVPLRARHMLGAEQSLLVMPAWTDLALGVKLVTVTPDNRSRGARSVQALYIAFDRSTGAPRALIDGEALTTARTAAASLLAARHLARADARRLLVVGTGALAPAMARALATLPTIDHVQVWGRDATAAQTLAQRLRDENLPCVAVEDLEAAVREADIVSCATTATAPVVHGAWLAPGTHLDLVGAFRPAMREVDGAAVARARVYVDTRAGALAEAGDLLAAIAAGVFSPEAVVGELADLVRGTCAGRATAGEITLFKSVGTALEDLAAAELLLARLD
jgi:ornithine cyclodeaminase